MQVIKRYFAPVSDISTFKRSFHCIMFAERSARVFRRRNRPRYTQIAIIRRFCRKLSYTSLPFETFRRLNALFTELCVQKVVYASRSASKQPQIYANCNNSSILSKIKSYFSRVSDISTFKRSFHCIMPAERSTRLSSSVETSPDTRKLQ